MLTSQAISKLVDARRAESPEEAEQRRKDVLQHMLDEGDRPDTGVRMSNQDIIDQMSELLLAGSETTSGTRVHLDSLEPNTDDSQARSVVCSWKLPETLM